MPNADITMDDDEEDNDDEYEEDEYRDVWDISGTAECSVVT